MARQTISDGTERHGNNVCYFCMVVPFSRPSSVQVSSGKGGTSGIAAAMEEETRTKTRYEAKSPLLLQLLSTLILDNNKSVALPIIELARGTEKAGGSMRLLCQRLGGRE